MKIKFYALTFGLIIFHSFNVFAQKTGKIHGSIKDYSTNAPLGYVNISIENSDLGTTTNREGEFEIYGVPVGTYQINFTYTGYETISKKVVVQAGKTTQLNISIRPKANLLEGVTVKGRTAFMVGRAASASQGQVSQAQLSKRPILRTGEILETVPGLIVTQHSGPGKANQYFFRGFNLDHGTDFSLSVDNIPINLPTHAHGQGYLDINFLIPELIDVIDFRKGPYYADVGDFSTTGNAQITMKDSMKQGIVKLTGGFDNYYRGLVANSWKMGKGHLLVGLNYKHYDGPWDLPDKSNLFSGIVKYSQGDRTNGFSVTAMGYHNKWNSTDQIPKRAVEEGLISRLGAVDSTDGGSSSRYSLVGNWWHTTSNGGKMEASLYVNYYDLDLFSNFTYYMEHPNKGDQIEQADKRLYAGGQFSYQWFVNKERKKSSFKAGLDLRYDHIFQVGLFNTEKRVRFNTITDDKVGVFNSGIYIQNKTEWTPWFKTLLGVRANDFLFDVDAEKSINSGQPNAFIAGPKASLIFDPWKTTEFYVNFGLGFHSNDARGVTQYQDPNSLETIKPTPALVRTKGGEIGVRTIAVKGWHSTFSLWYVGLNSELVFDGDAGGTEASGASTHYGIEWSNYYQINDWLALNADVSITKSYFNDEPKGANHIENSISQIITGGIIAGKEQGFFGSLRLRYFGPRPLNEEANPKSKATTILNFRGGYHFKHWGVYVDVLNLTNDDAPDISYYYESQLRNESSPVEDIHFHPTIPITGRLSVSYRF